MKEKTSKELKLELLKNLLLKKKYIGQKNLYFFNKYIAETDPERRKFIVSHVHKEWARWYHTSTKRIKLILVPRSCFKSTFFTQGLTLQKLAKNRNERVLIANATGDNAKRFLGGVKNQILQNKTYNQLYGSYVDQYGKVREGFFDKKLKWNEDEIEIIGRSPGTKEANVTAVGVGGNLVSAHFDTIIADDLVNQENSATRLQANKVIDWWKMAFSLLEPTGEMVIIGTRWAYYELYSYILENYKDEVDVYIRGIYDVDGNYYFPERFNDEKVAELKKLHGNYIFSAFYMNDPIDEDSAIIKKSQIQVIDKKPKELLKTRSLAVFSVTDPAFSQKASADYTGIPVVGVDDDDNWFILHVSRGKWTPSQTIEELFNIHKVWRPVTMGVEVIGQAQGFEDAIYNECKERQFWLPTYFIKTLPQTTKEIRIRSVLQPRFERGKIFICRGIEHFDDLVDEIIRFPKAKHDDLIDPLASIEMIRYIPDKKELPGAETSSNMEARMLRRSIGRKEEEYDDYDDVLGEDY